ARACLRLGDSHRLCGVCKTGATDHVVAPRHGTARGALTIAQAAWAVSSIASAMPNRWTRRRGPCFEIPISVRIHEIADCKFCVSGFRHIVLASPSREVYSVEVFRPIVRAWPPLHGTQPA